jgi:hypothetical protein
LQKWKSDQDALISDTMAMVAAARATESAIAQPLPTPEPSWATEVPNSVRVHAALWTEKSQREEIRERVASFRAHQEQWTRERQNYANAILRRIVR